MKNSVEEIEERKEKGGGLGWRLEVGSGKVIPKHKSLLSGLTDGGKKSHMQQ